MENNDGDHEMIVEDFNELFEEKSVAHESIILTEDDISDPHIHIDFEKLANYKVEHLKRWLVFRGDTLQGITTLKEAQVRVMSYFENKTEAKIVDPTPDKIWLRKKAEKMGVILKPLWKEGMLPSVPLKLKADMSKPTDLTGWSKSLKGMPNFTVEHIQNYHEHVNETFCKNSTKIKKHFIRGEQFLEEKFLDTDTIYVKEDETIFCLKGVAAASLKKANRWVFLAIEKKTSNIEFANCQCPAGRCGTCSHAYAMMKLLAKWVVDGLSMVPATKACTSKPCVWNVPQSRGRIEKVPIMEMMIKSPPSKKTKKTDNVQDKKGIVSSLYEPRIVKNTLKDDINFLIRHMEHKTPTNICATKLINPNPVHHRQTQFGTLPSGSYLSYQCSVMPPDFTVYCSIDRSDGKEYPLYQRYPQFPFQSLENVIDTFTKDIHIVEIKKNNILENLKSHSEDVNLIETSTRNQADDPNWFLYRKNRFTASLCNKLGKTGRKTEKSSKTLAHNIVTGSKKNVNRIMKMKMEYGRFYEPIAIQHYERYMKLKNFNITVEQSGLVIDPINFVLGATPDGKVICDGCFGILEVKCSEQYRDVDPKTICHISPNPCIVYNKENNQITINKNHTYYDQVQMQLAITTRTWCDFVFYTSKGLAIDRVPFDTEYWDTLQHRILKFYFTYMLPEIVELEE